MSQTVITPSKIGPYYLRGTIGEGAFSIVKLASHEKTQQYYACKIVPKSRLQHGNLIKRFESEIRIHQQMHHPGIIQLIDILKDDFNYYVLIEFCPNGDLFQFIVDHGRLSEEESKPFIAQIFNALQYIHSMGVTHRDLKPENILLDYLGQLKISDFGLSRFFDSNFLASTPCGSPCYASPECISGQPYNGITSDIWSTGVIIYAMLTGQLPWTKRNQKELFQEIRDGNYYVPNYLSSTCQSFIRGLMEIDYQKRLTIEQAFEHPFMKDCLISSSVETGYPLVSLKKVDYFFDINKDFDRIIPKSSLQYRTNTQTPSSFKSVLSQLRENLPEVPVKTMNNSGNQKANILRPHIAMPKLVIPRVIGPPPDARVAVSKLGNGSKSSKSSKSQRRNPVMKDGINVIKRPEKESVSSAKVRKIKKV